MKRVLCAAGLSVLVAWPCQAQLTGQVVDPAGRPLPHVIVVSRTGNGFLATRTDLDGRFAYPGRPHGAGHRIEASSGGFRSAMLRLEGGETHVTLTLRPGGTAGAGWALALPVDPRVQITDLSGTMVSPSSLVAGQDYRVRIVMRAPQCTQASDAMVGPVDDDIVIAVAAFTRSGCPPGEETFEVPYRFDSPGEKVIRVVGRRRDVTVPVSVRAAAER